MYYIILLIVVIIIVILYLRYEHLETVNNDTKTTDKTNESDKKKNK